MSIEELMSIDELMSIEGYLNMKAIISKIDGLEGELNPSPSKSYSHRAFYLSLLNKNPISIRLVMPPTKE